MDWHANSAKADPLDLLADQLDPPAPDVDVFGILGYTPTPKQREFHDAVEFDVLYGGAAGGGKTKAILMDCLRDCVRYPGIVVAAFRRSYPELEESLLAELAKVGYAADLGATYNDGKHDLKFANGSRIRFRYAETVKDATRRQGSEIQKLVIDERTQVDQAVVEYLATRLRSGNPRIPVLGIRSGTNPGGPGHGAVKKRFVEATGHGTRVVADPARPERLIRFIPAKVTDNPHVNEEYEADLAGISDPALRSALKDGNWDSFAGQFFPQWSRERHLVPRFEVPKSWRRDAGIDWGHAAPWAVVWVAVDEDRRVWVYREAYEAGVGETEQARRILEVERKHGERPRLRVADPSMWNKRGEVNPIATVYAANGCHVVKATNDRVSGWQRVHTYLDEAVACPYHRRLGWETCPRLHVFDDIEELPHAIANAPRDPDDVEDIDTKYDHDHDLDALRYVLMQQHVEGPPKPAKTEPATNDERFHAAVAKRRKKKGRSHPELGRI